MVYLTYTLSIPQELNFSRLFFGVESIDISLWVPKVFGFQSWNLIEHERLLALQNLT